MSALRELISDGGSTPSVRLRIMTDCNGSSHEIEWKDQYRRIGPEEIAESGYCVHCGDEVRRVFRASHVEGRPIEAGATHFREE